MGQALYPVRLYWAGMHGVARYFAHEVQLTRPPDFPGLEIDAIDYAPGTVAMVCPRHAGWRDLTALEIRIARTLIADLTHVDGNSSI